MPVDDIFSRLARIAERDASRPALVMADGAVTTYGELFDGAEALAHGLAARGLLPGDRVAFLCANRPEFVTGYLAVLRCGAAMLPINLAYRRREVAHMLADATPRMVFGGRTELAVLDELEPAEKVSVEAVIDLGDLARWRQAGRDHGLAPGAGASGAGGAHPLPDTALLLYTSGTTGRSKGAMISHRNLLAMIDALHRAWEWRAEDSLYLALPLFHMHGLVVGLHCALAAGAAVELAPKFDATAAIEALRSGRHSLFFGVPTLYVRLVEELNRRRAEGQDTTFPAVRLFASGSAPLAPETWSAFLELTGHSILERYGMTETGMLLSNPLHGRRIPGTVGTPLPGVELRLIGPEGEGDSGEVQVRGANVFEGYWNAPEKTPESFVEDDRGRRWFKTGDLARRDPDSGHIALLGRSSELILSGGFNVYPREVEEVLLTCTGVREAAVVGEPNAEWGESPVAFLVAEAPSAPPDAEALSAHCRRELAPFKLPRRFVFVDALPRNALGKVEKRRLLSELQSAPGPKA